jgi:hypothetical protein
MRYIADSKLKRTVFTMSQHSQIDTVSRAMPSVSPLLALAISYLTDELGMERLPESAAVEPILTDFIEGSITKSDAESELSVILGTSVSSIDKIEAILKVPADPLPDADGPPASRHGERKLNAWTPPEDIRLLAGVHRFGLDNWMAVAAFVGHSRTRAQCSQRWNRGLDPKLKKSRWSVEEESKLVELVAKYGIKSWTKVAAGLDHRSDVQCRYHFFHLPRPSEEPIQINVGSIAELDPVIFDFSDQREALEEWESSSPFRLNEPFSFGIPDPFLV